MAFLILAICMVTLGIHSAEAVKCLQCVDMPHPFDCNTVTECTAMEHCYVEHFITSSGIPLFNSGCLSKQRCSASKRDLSWRVVKRQDELLSKQDLVTCVECCQDEFCNIQGCYDNAVPRPKRGPKCFDCHAQEAPGQCRETYNCDYDQVCAILHEHPYEREWSSKCIGRIQCNALVRYQSHLIGRRDTYNVKDCPRCCEDDFCNDSCGHNVTYVPTTHASTRPPTTHTPITTQKRATTQKSTTHKPTMQNPVTHAPTSHNATTTHKSITHKPVTHAQTTHRTTTTHKLTTQKPRTHAPTTTHKTTTTHKQTTQKPRTHAPTTTHKTTTTHKPTTHKSTTHAPTTTNKPTTHVPTTAPHLVTTTDPRIACENTGYKFDPPTRMCLKFVMEKKNWTDAQADCNKLGGRLVVMTSHAKTRDVNHFLASHSKYHGVSFWVGATEISHVHTFTWTDGKTVVVDDSDKFDLTKTNCLLTANPKLAVPYQPCPKKNSYICENSNYIRA